MMGADTEALAFKMARINAKVLEGNAKAEREEKETALINRLLHYRNGFWVIAGMFLGTAATLVVAHWRDILSAPDSVVSWLGTGLTVTAILCGGLVQLSINQRRTTKKIDDGKYELRGEIRDARPADAEELARMNAQLESAIGAVIGERGVMIEQLNRVWLRMGEVELLMKGNEAQRQADLTQMRENGSKLFIAIDDRLDSIEESQTALMGLVNEAARKTLEVLPGLVEESAPKMVEGLPELVEEACRKAHAAGYVAGVQQRLNGSGAAVVPFAKP